MSCTSLIFSPSAEMTSQPSSTAQFSAYSGVRSRLMEPPYAVPRQCSCRYARALRIKCTTNAHQTCPPYAPMEPRPEDMPPHARPVPTRSVPEQNGPAPEKLEDRGWQAALQ